MIRSVKNFGAYLAVTLMLGAVLLAGCTAEPALTVVQPSQSAVEADIAQTPTGGAAETPLAADTAPHTYEALQTQIIRDDGQVIYDMTDYYKDYEQYGISQLVDGGDALYAAETAADPDDSDGETKDLSIVRIEYNGGRQVLLAQKGVGFTDLTSFGDWLFFLNDGFDSVSIGDVSKDGKELNVIDWEAYAARMGAEPYFLSASLTPDSDYLYVNISTFEGELEGVTHHVRIDKNMKLEETPLSEDQYLGSGSQVIMLGKGTGEKSVLYDAADYYDEDVSIGRLLKSDDQLYLVENVIKQSIDEHMSSIVRLDAQGRNRSVLCSAPGDRWYTDITLFDSCVFFTDNSIDNNWVGYVPLTGGDVSYIELTPEQQADSVTWMESEGDRLRIDMSRLTDDSVERYSLFVDKDFNVTVSESKVVPLDG